MSIAKIYQGRKFAWNRDLPDERDWHYSLHPEYLATPPLPAHVDLSAQCSKVEDQGNLGSCVLNAVCGGALEFIELQALKDVKDTQPTEFGAQFEDISRLFSYYNCRMLDGDTAHDNGTTIRTAALAVRKFGICKEKTWPYDIRKAYTVPSNAAYAEALQHKIYAAYRLDHTSSSQLMQCLANGYPFVIGISVYENFMSFHGDQIPKPQGQLLGGHAITIVGYDMVAKKFLIRNSWGKVFGKDGYAWIDEAYLTSRYLAADAWTFRKEAAAGAPSKKEVA